MSEGQYSSSHFFSGNNRSYNVLIHLTTLMCWRNYRNRQPPASTSLNSSLGWCTFKRACTNSSLKSLKVPSGFLRKSNWGRLIPFYDSAQPRNLSSAFLFLTVRSKWTSFRTLNEPPILTLWKFNQSWLSDWFPVEPFYRFCFRK